MRKDVVVLEQVRIKNAFGIKDSYLDFKLKNVNKNMAESEEQIILTENKDVVCMAPTFLGKNATGKTSLIKSIVFAMNLINKNAFIKTVVFYANSIFNFKNFDIRDYKNIFDSNDFLTNMCEQVMFAGSKIMQIELIFTNNKIILIELTPFSFQVKINNKVIDIISILQKIFNDDLSNKTRVEINEHFHKIIKKQISSFSFLSVVNNSIFRDTQDMTKINEILLKRNTNKFLKQLTKFFGVNKVRFLLKKLDSNIVNFDYDYTNKSISIHIKDNDIPISPNNLSFGTIKTIEILAKSIEIFKNGGLMLIDEIENGLHISLIKLILAFYSDEKTNHKKSQIILTTHNPLIFKQNVVSNFNAFMFENNNFVNIKKHKAIKRTEDQKGFTDPKNYYNDYYWGIRDTNNHTTISNTAINLIINYSNDDKNKFF